jgi:hypothetical protein
MRFRHSFSLIHRLENPHPRWIEGAILRPADFYLPPLYVIEPRTAVTGHLHRPHTASLAPLDSAIPPSISATRPYSPRPDTLLSIPTNRNHDRRSDPPPQVPPEQQRTRRRRRRLLRRAGPSPPPPNPTRPPPNLPPSASWASTPRPTRSSKPGSSRSSATSCATTSPSTTRSTRTPTSCPRTTRTCAA